MDVGAREESEGMAQVEILNIHGFAQLSFS